MATNEKDRLGDKLRQVERGREDQYFAERDRQLVEQLRRAKTEEVEGKLKEVAHMRCPKCGEPLKERRFQKIQIDQCTGCQGIWLDAGELEQVGGREESSWLSQFWQKNR